jgi:hypothetical protein
MGQPPSGSAEVILHVDDDERRPGSVEDDSLRTGIHANGPARFVAGE